MLKDLRHWFKYHYNWRYTPRPMTGFWVFLTPEQKEQFLKDKPDLEVLARDYVNCLDDFDSYDSDGSEESKRKLRDLTFKVNKSRNALCQRAHVEYETRKKFG